MATSTRADIREVFSRITKEPFKHEELLEQLYIIAIELGIAASDLGNKWESYAVNRQLKALPTLPHLHAFKQELREKHKSTGVVKKEKDRPVMDKSSLPNMFDVGLTDMLTEYVPLEKQDLFQETLKKRQEEKAKEEEERKRKLAFENTRVHKFRHEEAPAASSPVKSSSQPSSQPYNTRTNKGKIFCTLNEALPKVLASPSQVTVDELSLVKYQRCMNNKFETMTEYLEERLKRVGDTAMAEHKLTQEGLLERPSQETITTFGRLCSELDHHVTLTSFVIEGVAHGLKPRMQIDLSELESFSVFPGQISAVKGINNGKRFIVSQLLPPLPLPHRPPPVDGVSLLIAAGPFTLPSSSATSYEPFEDLIQQVKSTRPSAVVLLGPFVDLDHPGIKSPAELGVSFETVFRNSLKPLADLETHIFLVPSVKDAHHMFPYPQPPYGDVPQSKYIHPLSNPTMFAVNGVTIGASSVDVISLLVDEERFNFYPVYPPSIHDCVDVSLMKQAEMEHSPDILIVPSVRDGFVKVASSTVCVNPGKLVRNEKGGTYASIVVHPKEGSSGSANAVTERVRGEIIHI